MPSLDPFRPGTAALLVLIGTRITAMLLVTPAFSSTVVPRSLRVALGVVLCVVLYPAARVASPGAAVLTPAALGTEAVVGFIVGFGAAVLVGAAEIAGDVMSIQVGLSGAAVLDPLEHSATLVLGPFMRLTTVALLFSLGLHVGMFEALAGTFSAIPPGSDTALSGGLEGILRTGTMLVGLGVQFAAPVIATTLSVTLALAILTRAAPQFNAFAVAFPIQIGAGLVATGTAIAGLARAYGSWQTPYGELVRRMIGGLAATAP